MSSLTARRVSGRRRPIAAMNVVPYVDVMLVLLIIFMVTAPLLQQGIAVRLPTTARHALADTQRPLIVSIDAKGRYFLNVAPHPMRAMTLPALALRIKARMKAASGKKQGGAVMPHRMVLVKGDARVAYGKIVQLMSYLQRAGIKKVGLATQTPS